MIPVYVVQQSNTMKYAETHDSLDSRWAEFFAQAGLLPILLPNNTTLAKEMLNSHLAYCGVMTGGGTHAPRVTPINNMTQGTQDPRSQVEALLMDWAEQHAYPLIGCCRGMQAMMQHKGSQLVDCGAQIFEQQIITFKQAQINVNSYHNFIAEPLPRGFKIMAQCTDNITKSVLNEEIKWLGIMWHPERMKPERTQDIDIFKQFLTKGRL